MEKKIKKDKNNSKAAEEIILTTRARIARNIAGFKFSGLNSNEDKKKILNIIKHSFFDGSTENRVNKDYIFYNISRLSRIQRHFLLEKHVLSPEMLFKLYSKGLILKSGLKDFKESTSILINEEDHLRIQCIKPGLNIDKTYSEVSKVEKDLEKKIRFCYENDFGYLTSCPTNLGTALRFSVIAHLPALVISGKIDDFIKTLLKVGYGICGFFGENSEVIGNLFQISNQVSLGKFEKQIIEEINAICLNIVDEEKHALKFLEKNVPLAVEDSVLRTYGMLKYAKMLSYGESLELISMIKLGSDLGILKNIKSFDFYQLISLLGESNIILGENLNVEPGNDEVDRMRACIVKNRILE